MSQREYQTLTLETGEEITVGTMEYPYNQVGVLYLKFVMLNEDSLEPIGFLTVQPGHITKRASPYSVEEEEEMVAAAEEAATLERDQRVEYQKAVEEEMHRRAIETLPTQPEGADHEGLFG